MHHEVLAKPALRARSLSIAYRQRLPADEERAASARRRMALRLLVELLCMGVSQDVAGVLGVLQALVRAQAIPRDSWRRPSRPTAGRFPAAAALVPPHAVRGIHSHLAVFFIIKQPTLALIHNPTPLLDNHNDGRWKRASARGRTRTRLTGAVAHFDLAVLSVGRNPQ